MRKTLIAALAAAAAVGASAPAASAQDIPVELLGACTGTILPGGVGGYDISVAGRTFRVSKIEDITICTGPGGATLHGTMLYSHWGCGATCYSLHGPVSTNNPSVTARVCYTVDGLRTCGGDTYSVPVYNDRGCFVSVGKPAQHTPAQCLVVVDEDPSLPLP